MRKHQRAIKSEVARTCHLKEKACAGEVTRPVLSEHKRVHKNRKQTWQIDGPTELKMQIMNAVFLKRALRQQIWSWNFLREARLEAGCQP